MTPVPSRDLLRHLRYQARSFYWLNPKPEHNARSISCSAHTKRPARPAKRQPQASYRPESGNESHSTRQSAILTSQWRRSLSTNAETEPKTGHQRDGTDVHHDSVNEQNKPQQNSEEPKDERSGKQKSILELDRDLQSKMAGLRGDGNEAGVEYEDGQPTAMKRGVRENMFRYI